MRGIVFGLLFTNLVYLAWNLFVPSASAPSVARPVAQVGEGVQLLSEVPAEQQRRYSVQEVVAQPSLAVPEEPVVSAESVASAEPGPSADAPVEQLALYCAQIGPFRDEEDAKSFVSTHAQRMNLRVELRQVPAAPDYRVFLPAFASRELASRTQETLRAAFAANNLSIDTYLVPRGELENSIALGLFSEQSNALNVQQQMLSLGYQVVVRTEEKQASEAWVLATDIESAAVFTQHWAQMRLTRSYIDAGEKLCETIAHAPQFP